MKAIPQFPRVPETLDSIVKPEQLVDVVEMTPINLQDRRNFNILLGNSWNNIRKQSHHWISREELVRHTDSNNHDLPGSFRRLMATIIVLDIPNDENGEPEKRQIPLLGPNSFKEKRGLIKYSFPKELVDIIEKTQIFSRIHTKVMFALSSKYSLALYEWLQKRINLSYISYEVLTIEEVRGILNVGNKLKAFGHLNNKAIKPAVEEINYLTEYNLTAEPIKTGRSVTHVRFDWEKKKDIGHKIAVVEELERSKTGRKARLKQDAQYSDFADLSQKGDSKEFSGDFASYRSQLSQKSDSLEESTQKSDSLPNTAPPKLPGELLEKGKHIAMNAGTGWDIYAIEQQFYEHAKRKGLPNNYAGAWINFVKRKVEQSP